MRQLRRNKDKRGFTFAELIVAMMLITIVSVVALEFMAQYKKLAFKSSDMIIAANRAREKMEQLYMDNPGNWIPGSDGTPPVGTSGRSWNYNDSTGGDYGMVSVTVTLQSR